LSGRLTLTVVRSVQAIQGALVIHRRVNLSPVTTGRHASKCQLIDANSSNVVTTRLTKALQRWKGCVIAVDELTLYATFYSCRWVHP